VTGVQTCALPIFYGFCDAARADATGQRSHYCELSPRLSLALFGVPTRSAWIKDILIAGTYENGSDGFEAFLLGGGLTWDLPPFSHLETDLYHRDTRGLDGSTWQLTTAWALPFTTGALHWLWDGYLDIRGAEAGAAADQNFNPQLKLDLGRLFGVPDHFYAGVEYYHWNNKYGIQGLQERVLAPLVQARFRF
jgi:nucleoside-specific outer membrane channel protein Tsx